jgi:dienelactone hydrolase
MMTPRDPSRALAPLILAALLAAGCATAAPQTVFPSEPKAGTVFNRFVKPDGPGPFPAVVVLHTCGGLTGHTQGWANSLSAEGYAAVVIDSFTPRGGKACNIPSYYPATLDEVVADAFAALAYLRSRPDIDPWRVGVLGFSYGASAALRTSSASYRRHVSGGGFRAAASYYPLCVSPRSDWPPAAQASANNLLGDIETPTFVLMGADDNDTPSVAQNCAVRVAQIARSGRPISITMYPGAGHVFDVHQPIPAQAAKRDLLAFFSAQLKGGR